MNDGAKNGARGKLVPLRRVDGLPVEMSDEALLAACALGDGAALGALYDCLSPHVWRFLSRMAGNQVEELEDSRSGDVHRDSRLRGDLQGDGPRAHLGLRHRGQRDATACAR